MKEIKTVSDDPEFVRCNDAIRNCQAELLKVGERSAQVEFELLGIKQTVPTDADNQWNQFKNGGSTDTNSCGRVDALRAEQGDLQQRQVFLTEALEQGKMELDRIIGRLSIDVCKAYRPEFAKDAKEMLSHVKALCDIEQRSQLRRAELERNGVKTGSLPTVLFNIGVWQDPTGGRIMGYRNWLKENYDIS